MFDKDDGCEIGRLLWKRSGFAFQREVPRLGTICFFWKRFIISQFTTSPGVRCQLGFGHWNTVWKRFSRLSKAGVFDDYFALLADLSGTAHLVQMFDSTIVRAHVSAAGAKGGRKTRRWAAHAAASQRKYT